MPTGVARILAVLGVLLGIVLSRALDAAWVTHWYAGDRALPVVPQMALDAVFLTVTGFLAGRIGLWLAGSSARGVGFWVAVWVLATSAVDVVVGLANEPWWHEALTVFLMAPAAALGGGARFPRRHRRVAAPSA